MSATADTTWAYDWIDPRTVTEVCRRVDELVTINTAYKTAQRRIRDLMDGGEAGLRALVGPAARRDMDLLGDLPAGNPLLSGLTHMALKLQPVPDLNVEPLRDSQTEVKRAETRENIIRHMDRMSRLKMQMPQMGLWVPGYGLGAWVLRERVHRDGWKYPEVELRDPMETFPGDFGVNQQPEDVAFVRNVPLKNLLRLYPQHTRALLKNAVAGDAQFMEGSEWSNRSQGVRVAEYYDHRGCWWVVPERNLLLEYKENLLSGPQFVIPKRFAFNKLQGQYDHVIGLMAMMARLTVLQAQFVQDSVHTETNVFGQAPAEYRKGRFAINEFDQGTRVEKPINQMPFQAFQAVDRIERQLRTTARYPVTDDAQSPTAWATGAGLEELGSAATLEVKQYQTVFQFAFEDLDALRLEWMERYYGDREIDMVGRYRGVGYTASYRPSKAIAGNYLTERKYGFMAGWDESRKLVGGLQLTAAGIIPKRIMRENLDGLSDESPLRIDALLDAERAEEVLYDTLLQMGQAQDPRALTALIKLMPESDKKKVLESVFMPDTEEVQDPMAGMMPEQPPGLDELFANPQMLARMSQSGNPNSGGAQVMLGGNR